MFVEPTVTLWVEALQELFEDFPYTEMRGISIHTDYPLDVASYPGLWVQVLPQGDLRNAGIGHVEHEDDSTTPIYTWRFRGIVEVTVAALASLERAKMIDWLSLGVAHSNAHEEGNPFSAFREHVETNDLVGLNVIWEAFTIGGFAETPGTPWGTDDVIYEATLTLTMTGECRYSPTTNELVALSEIVVTDQIQSEGDDPTPPSDPDEGWV